MYYCTRPVTRAPSVCRAARNASFLPTPLAARVAPQSQNDFAPFLRLLDDFATPFAPAYAQHARQALSNFGVFPPTPTTFTPEFDVKEVGSKYELSVNVPGYEGTDLDVEFSDAQTLVISGRMNKQITTTDPQVDAMNAVAETSASPSATEDTAAIDNDDNASTYSTGSYQKPTVEEADGDTAQTSSEAEVPAKLETQTAAQTVEQSSAAQATPSQAPSQYWVKERRTGSFKRVFKFENRVDQDGVQASLKNGVLSVVVPKAEAPIARKISVL